MTNFGNIPQIRNVLENALEKASEQKAKENFRKLESLGLEYKYISLFLQKKLNKLELEKKLETAIHRFAKRQMSWFKRMEKRGIKIHWIENGDFQTALKIINKIWIQILIFIWKNVLKNVIGN